jgi:hypothetical protein
MSVVERDVAVDQTVGRPQLLRWLKILAPVTALVVLIQAIFAGRGLYVNGDDIDLHGMIGNFTFLLVLIQAGLAIFTGFRGSERMKMIGANALLLLLVFAQLGLGYSGRSGGTPASLHVPNGVLIFGLSVGITAFLMTYRDVSRSR